MGNNGNGYVSKIVDPQGRPIVRSSVSYEASSTSRRMGTWGMSMAGPDASLWSDLATLRARARQLTRNNPLAANAVDSLVFNLVGTGITPRWKLDNPDLKAKIQQLWADWTEEADFNGNCDFYGLQSQMARSLVEAGEVLVRLRFQKIQKTGTVPLQLQLLEPDHLDVTYNSIAPNGNQIRMGIEIDSQGKRAAYWLFRDHPGETFLFSRSVERVRVPAQEILHIFEPLRPGQMRGRPWLSPVISALYEIDQYADAERVRKKCAALIGGYIIEPPGESVDNPLIGTKEDDDSQGRAIAAMEPGTFPTLPPGYDIRFSSPADVGGNFEAWIKQQLREVAIGARNTYEQLTGDLSGVNYSSIRAGLLEFWRKCEALQWHLLIFQGCQPTARYWMDLTVASSLLSIHDYLTNRRAYTRIDWHPQGRKWVDPLKDVLGLQLLKRCGYTSRAKILAEQGYDIEDIDRENAEDNARMDALGLVYDSDSRKTQKSGAGQDAADGLVKGMTTEAAKG